MKKWKIILSIALATLFLVVTPLAVLAQSDKDKVNTALKEYKGGLAIVAPRVVLAGNEMQLTVFLRVNQESVSRVGVWAVPQANIEKLKNELKTLKQNTGIDAANKDYEPIIKQYADFLGLTGDKGRLTHTFNKTGNYLLVAYKKGYWPDWSGLAVRSLPAALEIKATPRKVHPGKEINISVDLKNTNVRVSDAGVWAIAASKINEAKARVQEFKEANKGNEQNADWDMQLNSIAMLLGRTDEKGNLNASFAEEGKYLLVAFKKGHLPGFTGIAVVDPQPETAADERSTGIK
jgi:hypothetical protein